MGKCYIFTEEELTALADSIRIKAGTENKMTMSEMCQAVRAIESATVAKYGVTDAYDFSDLTETGTIAQRCKIFPKYVGYKITSITNEGFRESYIEEFDFPLLSSIGNSAFCLCTSLTDVEIAATVLSIGDGAFNGCSNLENVEFKNAISSIPNSMFSNCNKLKEVIIPSGVTSIGEYAFQYCTALNLQELPNTLTNISGYAFRGCVGLTINELPDSITTLGQCAFYDCTNIEIDKLPVNLASIGANVFYNCSKVTIHEMNNDNWTSLPSYVFAYCTGMTHFTLPSALTAIPQYAFDHCTNLESVIIPASVISIGQYAFQYSGLKKIVIPDTVTSFSNYSFAYCSALEEVIIGSGITNINGSYVFRNCTSLKKVFFKGTPSSINSSTFNGCSSVTDIYVPWASGAVSGAPWGATNATIHYDTIYDQDLISLSIDSGNILMTTGSTYQFEVIYNPISYLVKEEQLGVTYSVMSGSEYITVDNNGLATMIADAPEGTTMTIRATSTYNPEIYSDATLTAIAASVEVDLNNGQWVDTGTTVGEHVVYQSDVGSYHVDGGLSRMTVRFAGYTSITAYIRSYAESSYDYTELGPLDGVNITRGAGTNVLSTSGKQSSTTYYSYTYENDGGEHSFEVIYSKDGSANSGDDRGYFYFVTN